MKWLKSIYINNFAFYLFMGILALFLLAYLFPLLYNATWILTYLFFGLLFIDFILVFVSNHRFTAWRTTPEKFSNGDENQVTVNLENGYNFPARVKVIDELPFQFQVRDFKVFRNVPSGETIAFGFFLRPTQRGEYHFGKLNVYVSSPLRLVARRFTFGQGQMVPTYPSYQQLNKYSLMAFSNQLFEYGIKKIRRLGHTMEFEQIKEYVSGDDIRTINWKATAKKNQLMVNQFQDERSQSVYVAIDTGRVMKMPFNGLSLLDYAINSALVLSSVIIKKQDKAGMLTFSRQVENFAPADRRQGQMQKIQENLYNVNTNFFESDFGRLYGEVKRSITQRSLMILYTNFETLDGLKRQLPYLKGLAKNHLLVVVFFENVELDALINKKAGKVQEIYDQVIAEKFVFEKRLIVNELKKYGIYSLLTKPENLTIDSINKYLEIKARGIL
ncbi:DUF58 domain-containing protein [Flavobacterium psychrotrophum]|uniref:DUF58 domain-containing protein n=1 Tax=Flavobacterium psychrotrophum TaxID=2294119 RepID=UPI000E321D4C|nr:DUF58 domain-containing protein [Flavobacterium psychrotrophum]